jgi:hypothetical protein
LPTFEKVYKRVYTSESDLDLLLLLSLLFSLKGFSVYSSDLLLPLATVSENDINADLGGLDFGGGGTSGVFCS